MERAKVLCFDPGDHTGWVFADWYANGATTLRGGTTYMNHVEVAELFDIFSPDIVVMERFNLYPGMAKSLSWNTFYPCEVIGVIRYMCQKRHIELIEQAPSIKKYSGGLQDDWVRLRELCESSEHMKDAYLHWKYFEHSKRLRNS